ncbi:MAG: DNA translocase FtsK [Candidatus Omnitrophica bacterium]|nr:DNA translocase FtsK [Candidatus Omnitrophota bacterium]
MDELRSKIVWSIVLISLCAFLAISFISYSPDDIPFNTSRPSAYIHNFAGAAGAYLVWGLLFSLGWAAYVIPVVVFLWAIGKLTGYIHQNFIIKFFGLIFSLVSFAAILSTVTASYAVSSFAAGGALGYAIAVSLTRYCGEVGTLIILSALFVLSLLAATEFMLVPLFMDAATWLSAGVGKIFVRRAPPAARGRASPEERRKGRPLIKPLAEKMRGSAEEGDRREDEDEDEVRVAPAVKRASVKKQSEEAARDEAPKFHPFGLFAPKVVIKKTTLEKKEPRKLPSPRIVGDYKLPSLELLSDPPPLEERIKQEDLEGNSRILEETLRDFGIEVKVMEVEQGPVIARYELQPAPGVKINKIMNLGDDIALNLKAPSVHIVAPIPGKGTIGIDVPNAQAAMVFFKELLETPEFQNPKSKLTLALGKDISGVPLIADLAEMPHLLIAGTTGSGKTVCVNTLIMSLLFQASPEEVKLILIDPKMVEMSMYNGLPHLICPVVTNVKKAATALEWAVTEMEDRYKLLSKVGARNITAYNKKIKDGLKEINDGETTIPLEMMPYIVIFIDELADMMLLVGKEVESSITRLAQLSRAIGIHLILATQRPSVDVITGVIKANFPARISFRVASKIDSRTVLDMNGADKLLGKGDMLFLKPGNFKLIRAQASLVADKEIEGVVNFVKQQRAAVFAEDVLKEQEDKILNFNKEARENGCDDLFEEAAKLVISTRQASVSMLQRRLRLGYARAARLIDMMEERGIVGEFRGSKAREILVESWDDVDSAAAEGGPGS